MNLLKTILPATVILALGACATSHKTTPTSVPLSPEVQRKADYFFDEALRQKSLGQHDAAFDLMRRAVELDTANAAGRYELANYYLQLGRPLVALDYVQGAVRRDPKNYWYGMAEAHLLQNLNMTDEAIASYRRLGEIYPSKPEINYSLADIYTQTGEIDAAIASLGRLEENVGMMEPITLEKHRLYLSIGETDSAFMEVKKLANAYPGQIQYVILLGDLYLAEGMLPQADSAYAAAARIEPDNGYLLVSRSDYFNRVGDIPASNELLQTALVSEALDVDTKVKLLTGYLKTVLQKRDSVALSATDSLFERVLAQHPQAGELHDLYAELLVTTDRLEDAREQQGYAVDLDPNDKTLWMQLIGINMRLKDYPAVVATATRAQKYLPDVPEFYLYRGLGYALQDDGKQALEAYLEGNEKIDPKNVSMLSDLWGQVGDIYHQMGETEKSYAAYDEALKYNEKNVGVLNNYSYFLSVENRDLAKAERMAGQVVKLEPNNPTYLDTYAWIFFRQGNYMLAKFYMKSAMSKSDEPSSDLLEHYGDILFMDGEETEALEQWQKALEVAQTEKPERDVTVLKKKIETKKYCEE